MLEDDDTFKQKESLEPDAKKPHIRLYIFLIVIWVCWTGLFSAIFFNKIYTAVADSGIVQLLENRTLKAQDKVVDNTKRMLTLFFYTPQGLKGFDCQVPRYGSDKYHDAVEGLFLGPDSETLANAGITYIAPKSKLLGLTYSNGTCYVDLSSSFNVENKKAHEQLVQTLLSFDEVNNVVLLIEGEKYN